MADPVTNTRSVVASCAPFALTAVPAGRVATASCANALDAMTRGKLTARVIRKNPNFTNPILIIISPWFPQGLAKSRGGLQDLFKQFFQAVMCAGPRNGHQRTPNFAARHQAFGFSLGFSVT
jgi:hypothetical protein